jgi:hypothetical protein
LTITLVSTKKHTYNNVRLKAEQPFVVSNETEAQNLCVLGVARRSSGYSTRDSGAKQQAVLTHGNTYKRRDMVAEK